ncbi:HlyD family efflux transporter periplasmic adaptor subunit [Pseudomonas sp. 5P_5.1_Bac1]|uniref:HlyD family efflux transporter periplasmic adaptor subunit n=1 Tax=Pseudomonas sp. 5P_5.1_Bac1 TaxID=2971616 RepID=UPI0021C73AC3|nr:HlyD family efflux transporter periplasmic adaptor subunit [Pseudomonas sp. 5P_5.1_Bac1]MCU1720281.1 HlyD family efflux transporter periplasmic adaptor subunit [Pseudomonas sp. 5P_5.1_Bac1]
MTAASASLGELREELRLHPGPRDASGAPGWTLEDPASGQFFRLGWAELEILKRWSLGCAQRIAEQVSASTTLELDAQDVERLRAFLRHNHLLQCRDDDDRGRLLEALHNRKTGWARWLLKNYLFVRVPLLRPDAFLQRTLPWVAPFFSRTFLLLTLAAGLLGLALVLRQWDTFTHTFLHFFTFQGAALAGLTLILAKVLHELGHAYTCKRHGARVATMGVALLVMWPVLYTDTSGAWRLARRRQRLAIGAAGMAAELALACWATLLWSFLQDGMLRSAVFTLASTTWILTLAVNLSPFMRFDGYFLLSDLLGVPNLQQRAFALTRWRLREVLFGFGDAPPEFFPAGMRRVLIGYSIGTWIYRFFLFLGIALLVYHFAFKLLGLLLFAVEIGYFILLPLVNEARQWYARRKDYRMNRNSVISLSACLLALVLLCLPWRSSVEAPALLKAAQQSSLYTPVAGRLAQVLVQPGDRVQAGQPLFMLDAPDLRHELDSVERRILILQWQTSFQLLDRESAAGLGVVRQELTAAQQRQQVLRQQWQELTVRAAFAGEVREVAEPLAVGEWLPAGQWLGTLVGDDGQQVEAFVEEHDLHRLPADSRGWFYPETFSRAARPVQLEHLAQTASRRLGSAPELASPYQGSIAASLDGNEPPKPEQALYRATLRVSGDAPENAMVLRGTVVLEGERQSLLWRGVNNLVAVVIRESAF